MIQKITFIEKWRCFAPNDTVEFHEGVNLMVGEQGTGKSSIFHIIRSCGNGKKIDFAKVDLTRSKLYSFDFEKENIRTRGAFLPDHTGMMAQLASMFSSHGQSILAIVKAADTHEKGAIILMDEPDMALSPRSAVTVAALFKKLAEKGQQVIASVHNPIIMSAFTEVLSLEHRKWMSSKEFLLSHGVVWTPDVSTV